jgi:hypothetical protein
MMDYELATISAREPWTTVARGGDYLLTIEYHDGEWTSPAPEVPDGPARVKADGRDKQGKWSLAPVGLGYPLAGVPRGALIGRTVDEDGRSGEAFLVGMGRTVGPFPKVSPGYFLIQLGPNVLNPTRARGAIRVRLRRRRPEEGETL